jgi:hypothetical protein
MMDLDLYVQPTSITIVPSWKHHHLLFCEFSYCRELGTVYEPLRNSLFLIILVSPSFITLTHISCLVYVRLDETSSTSVQFVIFI